MATITGTAVRLWVLGSVLVAFLLGIPHVRGLPTSSWYRCQVFLAPPVVDFWASKQLWFSTLNYPNVNDGTHSELVVPRGDLAHYASTCASGHGDEYCVGNLPVALVHLRLWKAYRYTAALSVTVPGVVGFRFAITLSGLAPMPSTGGLPFPSPKSS
ncbi:hypothetical protein BU15DRAFT_67950 [Melanogaster broomeanus]|nr:hypothetical protein BU15DRAFT_67950 [Melanogaster broomeanus]